MKSCLAAAVWAVVGLALSTEGYIAGTHLSPLGALSPSAPQPFSPAAQPLSSSATQPLRRSAAQPLSCSAFRKFQPLIQPLLLSGGGCLTRNGVALQLRSGSGDSEPLGPSAPQPLSPSASQPLSSLEGAELTGKGGEAESAEQSEGSEVPLVAEQQQNALDSIAKRIRRAPGALQLTLLASALLGMLTVVTISHNVAWDQASFMDLVSGTRSQFNVVYTEFTGVAKHILEALSQNGPKSTICFVVSDLTAQALESKESGAFQPDWGRAFKAGALGCLINGIGFDLWLGQLDNVFPTEESISDPLTSSVELGAKTITDSVVWGTLSNSFNIFARRLMDGSSPDIAIAYWDEKILDVTFTEFKFWPLWNLVNFALLPREYRVAFGALGALLFNIYISAVSSSEETQSLNSATSESRAEEDS